MLRLPETSNRRMPLTSSGLKVSKDETVLLEPRALQEDLLGRKHCLGVQPLLKLGPHSRMRMENKYPDFLFFLPASLLQVLLTDQIISKNHLTRSPGDTVCGFSQTGLQVENGSVVGQSKQRINSTSLHCFAIVPKIKTKFFTWPTMPYIVSPLMTNSVSFHSLHSNFTCSLSVLCSCHVPICHKCLFTCCILFLDASFSFLPFHLIGAYISFRS